MKQKYILLSLLAAGFAVSASAQSAIDAMRIGQQDMKGTARFMSMGGAFGALGGDLTTLSQNPAGIGVYRSNEVGVTVDLDVQSALSSGADGDYRASKTHFLLNNIGGVLTLRLPSRTVPNLNFGFTYNKTASFNRTYGGNLGQLQTSMTNWMAGVANANELTVGDVETIKGVYDPYNPNDGGYAAPWIAILAYDSFFINPIGDPDAPRWTGQFGQGTTGTSYYRMNERGSVDSFNIAVGGNFGNVVFWGMDFDITSLNYTLNSTYGENLDNAYVMGENDVIGRTSSQWQMRNYYNMQGTGFAYKLGLIFRPIQEFRVGFAFHTPTYYNVSQYYGASTDYIYNKEQEHGQDTNGGDLGYSDLRYQSPWHIIVSAAGVIGKSFIISADYEWTQTSRMKFKDPGYFEWHTGAFDNSYNPVNNDISSLYQNQNTFRVGAEFRVTPKFSVRAGYCNVSSPVRSEAKNGHVPVYTAGTMPEYRFDNTTNYYSAGLGYRTGGFYADLAYVHKQQSGEYHAFSPDGESNIATPGASVNFTNNQIVLSLGYKF